MMNRAFGFTILGGVRCTEPPFPQSEVKEQGGPLEFLIR